MPAASTSEVLLNWYDRHHRALPWRSPPLNGVQQPADPYIVWLSEIMLQQTTVVAAKPYFERFVSRWPDVYALADAEEEHVMAAWAGLGYYSRARNLLKCARSIKNDWGGEFPRSSSDLQKLPGIGPYTASAIASICFAEQVPVIDGNVERVIARLAKISDPLPGSKTAIYQILEPLVPSPRPGDFAQAMMDLGATICTPRNPACAICPVNNSCLAFKTCNPGGYPVKLQKKPKPKRTGSAFVVLDAGGRVLIRKRPDQGMLASMFEVPGSNWSAQADGSTDLTDAPVKAEWETAGQVKHVFTHFELYLTVYSTRLTVHSPEAFGTWEPRQRLTELALPSLMLKVLKLGLAQLS